MTALYTFCPYAFPCLTATEASEAGPLAGPFPSRQAGNRQVAISLARGVLFRGESVLNSILERRVLISLARGKLFRVKKFNRVDTTKIRLNLSCERKAFQGKMIDEMFIPHKSGLNLSCERKAFQGRRKHARSRST